MYKVLLCDDDAPYAQSLVTLSSLHSFDIKHVLTWEEAQDELEQHFDSYDGVILDALGQRNSDSQRNDIGALTNAVMWLKTKEGQGKYIPYLINSAYVETSVNTGFEGITHFDKTQKQEMEMFTWLQTNITDKQSFIIRRTHPNVFEVFGGRYLPEAVGNHVLSAFKLSHSRGAKQKDFNMLRDVFEEVLLGLHRVDKKIIPGDLIKADGRPNLEWCFRYLLGLQTDIKDNKNTVIKSYPAKGPIPPAHVGKAIDYIKTVSSIFSHSYQDKWTSYSFDSCLYALCEIILWYKTFIDKNYPV